MSKLNSETKRSDSGLRAHNSWLHKQRDGLPGYRPRRLTLDCIEPADAFGACLRDAAWTVGTRLPTKEAEERKIIRNRGASVTDTVFGDEFNPDDPTCLDLTHAVDLGLRRQFYPVLAEVRVEGVSKRHARRIEEQGVLGKVLRLDNVVRSQRVIKWSDQHRLLDKEWLDIDIGMVDGQVDDGGVERTGHDHGKQAGGGCINDLNPDPRVARGHSVEQARE